MSVLSEWDVIEKLGKEVLIYPFKGRDSSFRGCDICLTASEYAYSVQQQNRLQPTVKAGSSFKCFEISAGDTVLIWTSESVSLSNTLCGSIHSRVGLVSQGLGHIGTRVNPNWGGVLAIALQNSSTQDVRVSVGEVISYLRLHELSSKSSSSPTLDDPGRLDIIPAGHGRDEIRDWINDQHNKWRRGDKEVLWKMLRQSEEYEEAKREIRQKSKLYRMEVIARKWAPPLAVSTFILFYLLISGKKGVSELILALIPIIYEAVSEGTKNFQKPTV